MFQTLNLTDMLGVYFIQWVFYVVINYMYEKAEAVLQKMYMSAHL